MNDLIHRSDVEKMLKNIPTQYVENMGPVYDEGEYTISIDEALGGLSAIQSMDEWIPLTDRFPNEGESVLVSLRGIVYMAHYYPKKTGNQWYFGGDYIDTPEFWIPLPLPPSHISHDK